MNTKREKKTPEQKLAALMEKQKGLAEQIQRQRKLAEKRDREAIELKLKRAGQLMLDAGLLELDEGILIDELKKLADTHLKPAKHKVEKADVVAKI